MKVNQTMFKIVAGLIVGAVMAFAPAATTHAAASAVVFVSPASGTYTKGNVFSVVVYEDSGDNDADSAHATLSYDSSKLEAQGISAGDFTTCVSSPSASGGSIDTGNCTILGAKKRGQQRLATVTFKAIAEGNAAVNFTGAQVVNGGTNLPVNTVNASFTVAAPVQGGMGGGSTSTGSTSGSSSSSSSANHVATTGSNGSTTPATSDDSAATSDAANNKGEVKTDATKDTKKDTTAAKNDDSQKTDAKGKSRNWLPLIIILVIAAGAALYAYRNRSTEDSTPEAGNDTPQKDVAAKKPVEAAVVAPAAKKAQEAGNKQQGNANRNKKSGNRQANKRNR